MRGSGVGAVRRRRKLQTRRVAPQPVQTVERPLVLQKDVDHEIDVVEKHPVAGALAFDVTGGDAELLVQTVLDLLGDGYHLPVGGAVTDDEVVREIAPAVKIENDDFLGLLVAEGVDGVRQFRGQLLSSRWKSLCV